MYDYDEKTISRFRKGDNICGFFFLKTAELRSSNQNSRYLDMTFCDATGEMNAKMWNATEGDEILYKAGAVVYAECLVKEFQGSLQLRVDNLRRANAGDGISLSELVPTAPVPQEEMFSHIRSVIDGMQDPDFKKLTDKVITEHRNDFEVYPAAKSFHHSVRCGLMYHTYTMLKAAEQYVSVYPELNKDLLFCGVILHDIGKTEEMELMDCGLVSEYSLAGRLLGHIVEGVCIIDRAAKELGTPKEKALLVEHMILSHHYEPEYGSPKKPAFPEAELLHYLDTVDARMYDMQQALSSTRPGEFSEKINSLEKREIYRKSE